MRERFIGEGFKSKTLPKIAVINQILEEDYAPKGYQVTLRQLFYQLVSKNIIANTENEYKNLGALVAKARMTGHIDWSHIVDLARPSEIVSTWDTPAEVIASAADCYREDLWKNQPYYVELLCEKQALNSIIWPICRRWGIQMSIVKGYSSVTVFYQASKRMLEVLKVGRKPVILHLGDHDPSGLDMTRSAQEKISLMAGTDIEVRRIGLNLDQIRAFNITISQPVKKSDTRAKGYMDLYGGRCWELDALNTETLVNLTESAVAEYRDDNLWKIAESYQEINRKKLEDAARRWN